MARRPINTGVGVLVLIGDDETQAGGVLCHQLALNFARRLASAIKGFLFNLLPFDGDWQHAESKKCER